MSFDFKNISLIQIISGYETKTSYRVLESNLVETGLVSPVIHDKSIDLTQPKYNPKTVKKLYNFR